MEHCEYERMFELESTYWWYVGRRAIIASTLEHHLDKPVSHALDIGCGTGANLSVLSRFGTHITGLDTAPEALEYCRRRGWHDLNLIEQGSALPVQSNSTGLVTLLDVLEHVPDEQALLSEAQRVLNKNGLLLITVPAFQFLWSEHDVALHHYRRYTKPAIIRLLADADFEPISSSYVMVFSFPIIIAYRALKGLLNAVYAGTPKTSHVRLPALLNAFFIGLLVFESRLLRYLSFPFGTSILVVARKANR